MKGNKGFISISIIYSFFLVFIAIIVGILANYISNRTILNKIKDDVRNNMNSCSNNPCYNKGIYELSECILDTNGYKIENLPFEGPTIEGEALLGYANDDLGVSYYFRGDVKNNYVKFGKNANGEDMYWRILRINGDGTIRLIYDGLELVKNSTPHTATAFKSFFNDDSSHPKYVGYTYDDGTGTGKQVNSTIKSNLDEWYQKNLQEQYSNYIADGIFCNDKYFEDDPLECSKNDEIDYDCIYEYGIGHGLLDSSYQFDIYNRLQDKKPTFKCGNINDRYTVDDTINGNDGNYGNGLLDYPIGIVSADELIFAGAIKGDKCSTEINGTIDGILYNECIEPDNVYNNTNFIYSYESFWTMSPTNFDNLALIDKKLTGNCGIEKTNDNEFGYRTTDGVRFHECSAGRVVDDKERVGADVYMYNKEGSIAFIEYLNRLELGVRPVINLKTGVSFCGNGTIDDPYVIGK